MPRLCGLLILAMLLIGCQTRPTKPQVVEIPGPTVYVEIPAAMVHHCPIEKPRDATPLEAVRVAKARGDSLASCNRKLDAIDAIEGTKVP